MYIYIYIYINIIYFYDIFICFQCFSDMCSHAVDPHSYRRRAGFIVSGVLELSPKGTRLLTIWTIVSFVVFRKQRYTFRLPNLTALAPK